MYLTARTIGRLFLARTQTSATRNAIGWIENQELRFLTYKEYRNFVECISLALISKNLKKQDKVCILGETSKEWHLTDISVIACGAITVPIYHTYPSDDIAYILKHCEAKIIFVSDSSQLKKVLSCLHEFKNLEIIASFNDLSDKLVSQIPTQIEYFSLKTLIDLGSKLITEQPDVFETRITETSEDDVATIIYTSGTTGKPKGAIITHRAFTQMLLNIEKASNKTFNFRDRSLTFLPLSHVFGRCDSYLPLIFGWECVYARSGDKVIEDIKIAKPTIMLSVPRVFEKIYQKIQHEFDSSSLFSKKVVELALDSAKKYFNTIDAHKSPSTVDVLKYHLAYKTVFEKIYNTFGGRIRFFISGGAPLSPAIIQFLRYCNLTIVEGYGLTETIAPCCLNPFSKQVPGTVGRPIGDVEFKFTGEGEILIRSEALFSGYLKDPEASENAFYHGWFKTGDIGNFTPEGHLKITDRIKNIIITSGGKNVSPQKLETLFTSSPRISQFITVGDNRNYLTGLVGIERSNFLDILEKLDLDETITPAELAALPEVKQEIQRVINEINEKLPRYETIKKFYILPIELNTENYLTPSLKVKRDTIINDNMHHIESMY